ncbi:hypothetical protein PV04_10664 [Phialophora macrospora]|uniref:Amidohydrolase-related domain-containing protein n=1 Tax=Phialophora macrospora TaxID=1851006 RepID=A0A0D2CBU8_9EURO|nr:hypothetical protein PV04_10664 [Phialophora macrospora]
MAPVLIGLEEHFASAAVTDKTTLNLHMFPQKLQDDLADLGERRIKDMDQGNMEIQVISHFPAVTPPETCRAVNDGLFEAVNKSNGRFRGFACLPIGEPQECPKELERCVKELNFVGALVGNHANGRFFDGPEYWPMFEKAQELDVPIYIHPTSAHEFDRFAGNYDNIAQTLIAGPALCWHTEIAMHFLRLFASGLFDHVPRVKIILGHNGESMPFMRDRIDKFFSRRWGGKTKRDFITVWHENVWITTSGFFHLGPLKTCLEMCKPDRVMYSLDYPYEDTKEGLEFMVELESSGLVTKEQFEMICSGNARKLLRL